MAGDIDPFGTRKAALDTFLEEKVGEGFEIETQTDTHAIIVEPSKGMLSRIGRGDDPVRYVVEVDEAGVVNMSPAQPRRKLVVAHAHLGNRRPVRWAARAVEVAATLTLAAASARFYA